MMASVLAATATLAGEPLVSVMRPSTSTAGGRSQSKPTSRSHSPLPCTSASLSQHPSKSGSLSEFAREGGEEAPSMLEHSGDQSPCSSERSTPPYMLWAKDLSYVLDDWDGFHIFKTFLQQESSQQLLDFYLACKTLFAKDLADTQQAAECEQLVQGIYRRFIRKSAANTDIQQWLPESIVTDIRERVRRRCYDRGVYSAAKEHVIAMLHVKHAAFVQSDLYLAVQQQHELHCQRDNSHSRRSPSVSSSSSSVNGELVFTTQGLSLHTVQEEQQSQHSHSRPSSVPPGSEPPSTTSVEQPPPLMTRSTIVEGTSAKPVVPPRPAKDSKEVRVNAVADAFAVPPPARRARPATSSLTAKNLCDTVEQRLTTTAANTYKNKPIPHPYHTNYVPQLPPSMRDSAVSSSIMSSEADTQSHSSIDRQRSHLLSTAGSQTGTPGQRSSHAHRHSGQRTRDAQARCNREGAAKDKIIPRTERAPPPPEQPVLRPDGDAKQREHFASVLSEKLVKLKAKLDNDNHLNKLLSTLSQHDGTNSSAPKKAIEDFSKQCSVNTEASTALDIDDAILEDHMSRIGWNDSAKQSPGNTAQRKPPPGYDSPDRRSGRPAVPQPQFVPPADQPSSSSGKPTRQTPTTSKQPFSQKLRSFNRPALAAVSDTSGIESGTSSGTSAVTNYNFPYTRGAAAAIPPAGIGSDERKKYAALAAAGGVGPGACSTGYRPSHKSQDRAKHSGKPIESQSLPRRSTRRSLDQQQPQQQQQLDYLPIYYTLPNDDVPYMITTYTDRRITLHAFKQIVFKQLSRKPTYRFFFKCFDDTLPEAGGVMWREVSEDAADLPLFDGKLIAKIVPIVDL